MGGAHGRISHVYDDYNLSFSELKDIVTNIQNGTIETYEKIDGINLYVTWDSSNNELRVARNKKHIKLGGINRVELEQKYNGRGSLKDAFIGAYDVLNNAFGNLTKQTRSSIFGSTGGVWYSIDIVYPEARNLIKYDNNFIVFHKIGVTMFDWDGNPMVSRTDRHFNMLNLVIKHLNDDAKKFGWRIYGPSVIKLNQLGEESLKNLSTINSLITQNGLRETDKIKDYLRKNLKNDTSFLFVPYDLRSKVLDKMLGENGSQSLRSLYKGQIPAVRDHIKSLVSGSPNKIRALMTPIESVLYEISCSLLGGCKSFFVSNPQDEINRLRSELMRAISVLEKLDDENGKFSLLKHKEKLRSANKINTSVEGVVFLYRKKPYKITGVFAPANQIYQQVKYKISPVKETNKNTNLKNYVLGISAG